MVISHHLLLARHLRNEHLRGNSRAEHEDRNGGASEREHVRDYEDMGKMWEQYKKEKGRGKPSDVRAGSTIGWDGLCMQRGRLRMRRGIDCAELETGSSPRGGDNNEFILYVQLDETAVRKLTRAKKPQFVVASKYTSSGHACP
jgi:hypothetical protein